MLTAYDKFLVAFIMAALEFLRQYSGVDLGISEETVSMIAPFITAGLVWFTPNKKAS